MTLGEKLAKLRRDNNYTQEQLAELLDVSRQAISKWESDASYPETDKLIKLGALYRCSMDYLLKNDADNKPDGAEEKIAQNENETNGHRPTTKGFWNFAFERKSAKSVRGVPLWHVNIGLGREAKGIIAIGFRARGVISIGILSVGVLSIGLLSLGLISLGVFSLGLASAGTISVGLIAVGAICLGIIAVGAISVGVFSLGALAVGQFSTGALAIGKYYALGDHAYAMIAIGATKVEGSVFQADAVTNANYNQIISLLYDNVPKALHWCVELVKPLM
ncbi:MAG: helix-turn-helix transcriptional regulator [Clostridiales bacterium]|nr:helix-turn-helix transcriptional regulator [Clostridiales bacterium]